jgi:hypothetical protein
LYIFSQSDIAEAERYKTHWIKDAWKKCDKTPVLQKMTSSFIWTLSMNYFDSKQLQSCGKKTFSGD